MKKQIAVRLATRRPLEPHDEWSDGRVFALKPGWRLIESDWTGRRLNRPVPCPEPPSIPGAATLERRDMGVAIRRWYWDPDTGVVGQGLSHGGRKT